MKSLFAKMVDSSDDSVELHLVIALVGALALIAFTAYSVVWLGHQFDATTFGEGLGLTSAGSGAAAVGQGLQRRQQKNADWT